MKISAAGEGERSVAEERGRSQHRRWRLQTRALNREKGDGIHGHHPQWLLLAGFYAVAEQCREMINGCVGVRARKPSKGGGLGRIRGSTVRAVRTQYVCMSLRGAFCLQPLSRGSV